MGRGSASQAMVLAFILGSILLLHCQVAESAVYTVGGNNGWSFNTANWPKGKTFKAGDVLVFKYNPSVHNVVAVSAAGYKGCNSPRGAKVYKSGNDRVTLARGRNFFICGLAGHCQSGMKIAVTAA
ncbi:basic blue protein-like [Carex rostrata]